MAVLDFSPHNIHASYAIAARERIEYILFKSGLFNVLERKHIELLTREYQIVTGMTESDADAIKIGKTLSSDYIITGEIIKSDQLVISIRITEVQSGKIIHADSETLADDTEVIRAAERLGNGIVSFFKEKNIVKEQAAKLRLSLNGGYLRPVNDLKDIVKDGFAAETFFGLEDMLLRSLTMGIHMGYMQFRGTGSIDYAAITPIMFETCYAISLPFTNKVFAEPLIAGGISYVILKKNGKTSGSPEPLISAGCNIQYRATREVMVTAGFRHLSLIERNGLIHYCSFTAGIGYIFNFYR